MDPASPAPPAEPNAPPADAPLPLVAAVAAPTVDGSLDPAAPPPAALPVPGGVLGAVPTDGVAAPPVKVKTRKAGAEVAFRIMFREQVQLTSLADNKAHMMIQINGLIMSIMLASTSIILDARPWLRLPCIALASTALVSIVFAVVAARPRLNRQARPTPEDLASGRVNILFFGNSGRISEQAFVTGMREMFADDDRVYLNMSRHIHGLGSVLLRKFELLRVSYTAFLVGLFVSGALFIVGLVVTGFGP